MSRGRVRCNAPAPTRSRLNPRGTRLCQNVVASTKPEAKEFVVWDGALPGFGLRVRPTGHKTFIAKFRVKGASPAQRKVVIGSAAHIKCTDARNEAQTLMAKARLGIDPTGRDKKNKDAPITLSEFWTQYDRDHIAAHKKSSSADEDRRLARCFLLPQMGDIRLEEIDAPRIRALHSALRETPTQANRVLALVSSMISKATKWGVLPHRPNPCCLIDKYKETPCERFLSETELARLMATLDQHAMLNPVFANAIRLILFTGMRKSEALTLKWSEVDLAQGRINFDDSKTGKKSVPLNDATLALLDGIYNTIDLTETPDPVYVFPGRDTVTGDRSTHAVGIQKFWERVRHDAQIDDVRIHDLRHSFASFAAANGVSLPVIGGLLGHKDVRSTARYTHLTDTALRDASNKACASIKRATSNEDRDAPDDRV